MYYDNVYEGTTVTILDEKTGGVLQILQSDVSGYENQMAKIAFNPQETELWILGVVVADDDWDILC